MLGHDLRHGGELKGRTLTVTSGYDQDEKDGGGARREYQRVVWWRVR